MINFEKTLFIWFYFEQIQFANKFTQIPQILLNYHLSFSLFFPQIFFSHKSLVVRYYFFNITQKIELTQIKSKSEAIHKIHKNMNFQTPPCLFIQCCPNLRKSSFPSPDIQCIFQYITLLQFNLTKNKRSLLKISFFTT